MTGSEATQSDINPNVENYTISRDIDVYAGLYWLDGEHALWRKETDRFQTRRRFGGNLNCIIRRLI